MVTIVLEKKTIGVARKTHIYTYTHRPQKRSEGIEQFNAEESIEMDMTKTSIKNVCKVLSQQYHSAGKTLGVNLSIKSRILVKDFKNTSKLGSRKKFKSKGVLPQQGNRHGERSARRTDASLGIGWWRALGTLLWSWLCYQDRGPRCCDGTSRSHSD